jgi:hypothetical protein
MSPEALSSAVEPASDTWAAGVMAFQLLSGRFPFDDWQHPDAPSLSLVWRSILTEVPKFAGKSWEGISEEAKDFCRQILNKWVRSCAFKDAFVCMQCTVLVATCALHHVTPTAPRPHPHTNTNTNGTRNPRQRPSARDALQHPWLVGDVKQRGKGAQLNTVVQRLQRYNQQNVFKRTILDMMANELIRRHLDRLEEEDRASGQGEGEGGGGSVEGSVRGGGVGGSMRGGGGGVGGSMRGGGGYAGGSLRGSMTALEALRRARERRSHADMGGGDPSSSSPAPPSPLLGLAAGSLTSTPLASPAAAHTLAGTVASPTPLSPEGSRGGDPSNLAWDLQFMAHRMALEGSGHGNEAAARWGGGLACC